jgi:ATP-dependent exoDNAse (exonuclease V) alpha subunit
MRVGAPGPFSDAVSVLAQDRPAMGIVSGQGGATGQRERVAELTLMAREQGRDVHILAADNRSRDFLAGDVRLAGETVTGKSALQDGTAFIPGGTLIVDQAEKLSLKETISLLDGAMRHNVQVLLSDSGKRSGTGSALTVLKDSGVNTYRWQGGHQTTADIISEPDKVHATAGWHRSLPSACVKGRKAWRKSAGRVNRAYSTALSVTPSKMRGCWVRKTRPLQP